MLKLTEKTLPKSGLIILNVVDHNGKHIACHTSTRRSYINGKIARYTRQGNAKHQFIR